MKFLYKYPQQEFPYSQLIEENRCRGKDESEFELLDTGIFDEDHYFDVFVEYAKADVEDILIKITIANRGPKPANLRVLPTIWFRNTWSWGQPRGTAAPMCVAFILLSNHRTELCSLRTMLATLRRNSRAALHRK